MFLAPGAPTIVTAAGIAVFVIKQKRAVPKKHCSLPTGGEPLAFGGGELRHPNRNGVQARFLVALHKFVRCEKRLKSLFPCPLAALRGVGSQFVVSPM